MGAIITTWDELLRSELRVTNPNPQALGELAVYVPGAGGLMRLYGSGGPVNLILTSHVYELPMEGRARYGVLQDRYVDVPAGTLVVAACQVGPTTPADTDLYSAFSLGMDTLPDSDDGVLCVCVRVQDAAQIVTG